MERELSTFLGPDGLRKALHFSKAFFDSHTKKNVGYKDMNGYQYSGTTENFGAELLLEARKLLMSKPPLDNVFLNNTFDFYFDIQYSDIISTYDQQNMLVAVLEKDAFLSNKRYTIRFNNCEDVVILRSASWSDPDVSRCNFVKTTTPPTLVIEDLINPATPAVEISLYLEDDPSLNTVYYFLMDNTTEDMIDTYAEGTLVLNPITDAMHDRPFVWMCIDVFRLLPDIGFVNNADTQSRTLMTVGTDGHATSMLYPYIYGTDNVPVLEDVPETNQWFVKVEASDDTSFEQRASDRNFSTPIKQISFVNTLTMGQQPFNVTTITFDHDYLEMTLLDTVPWVFKTPVEGDYDYDGTTYINRCYAYIPLSAFIANLPANMAEHPELTPAIRLWFAEEYLNIYEANCENAVSGVHVDVTSDFSDNGVSKKNGVIHGLGDFDGLPPYYKYMLDRKLHRAHVEMYSIRDDLNNPLQKPTDKQTAAIIADSAIPQTEMHDTPTGLPIVIRYNSEVGAKYVTAGESPSPNNALSEIVYVSPGVFSNCTIAKDSQRIKFIYHGHRTFSTKMIQFDKLLEYARCYHISNDPSDYDNNASSSSPKPARTIARICDIPTSFTQLSHIEDMSPTLVIDTKYCRTECDLSETDQDMLYNVQTNRLVKPTTVIVPNSTNLNTTFTETYLKEHGYAETVHMNQSIDMHDPASQTNLYTITVYSAGTGYQIHDTFTFNICGIAFDGAVSTVSGTGGVAAFTIVVKDRLINVANFDGRVSTFETSTVTGAGSGFVVQVSIDQDTWNNMQPAITDVFDDLFLFKLDEFGNTFVWTFDTEDLIWVKTYQMTGMRIVPNAYDTASTQSKRITRDVLMANWFNCKRYWSETVWTDPYDADIQIAYTLEATTIPYGTDLSTDLSDLLNNAMDKQNTYYYIHTNDAISQEFCTSATYTLADGQDKQNQLPTHHQLDLYSYINKCGMLSVSQYANRQPNVCIFNPRKTTIDTLTRITADAYRLDSRHDITFVDLQDATESEVNYPDILNVVTGRLNGNVYTYDEFSDTQMMMELKSTMQFASREELIGMISSHTDWDPYPLQFENTEYAFTRSMLINYILEITYNDPVYKKRGMRKLRDRNDIVVERSGNEFIAIGDQPVGGFEPISAKVFNPNVGFNGEPLTTSLLYVFRIESTELPSLTNFRMLDGSGKDISANTLLIVNQTKYVFMNNAWTVVQ
jgi:hypothetical protein